MKFLTIILILYSFQSFGRDPGQTEITTDEGIEVFKQEKYYLLKKNVKIVSDDFKLSADLVKAHFNEGLYDVEIVNSKGNVLLESSKGIFIVLMWLEYVMTSFCRVINFKQFIHVMENHRSR